MSPNDDAEMMRIVTDENLRLEKALLALDQIANMLSGTAYLLSSREGVMDEAARIAREALKP